MGTHVCRYVPLQITTSQSTLKPRVDFKQFLLVKGTPAQMHSKYLLAGIYRVDIGKVTYEKK